jgi:hypothetical protein
MVYTVGQAKANFASLDAALRDTEGIKKKVEASFARLDADKSGHLDAKEARQLIGELCQIMNLPAPNDNDYENHMKMIDQSGDTKLDVNEVGAAIVGALIHRANGLKHFLGIASSKGLKDEDELPRQ